MTEQEKREKVIKELGSCVEYFANKVKGVMFDEWLEESRKAIALLKEQEPRVMTLEEALSADECRIEGRSGACGYGDALLTDDAERVEFFRPHTISTLDFYAYGKDWRCWTARPTDEQRKAVKWE